MRKITILEAVDGYAAGDTPIVFGPKGRELIAAGKAEWADDSGSTTDPVKPRTEPVTKPITRPITEVPPKAKPKRARKAT